MLCECKKSNVSSKSFSTKNNQRVSSNLDKDFMKKEKILKKLRAHCKNIDVKKVDRLGIADEIKYNDYLQMTGISSSCPGIPSAKIKIYPTLFSKKEIERIQESSKFLSDDERLKEKQRLEEEALRAKTESEKRKALLKRIDAQNQKDKKQKENNVGKEVDPIEIEKQKAADRVFMFKQEQQEEVKKANKIILNAKCHAIREVQLQQRAQVKKDLINERTKLEKEMLEIDKKYIEEDEKRADEIRQNQEKYAEEIRKQIELKENIIFSEIQRKQDEDKIKSELLEKLLRDGEDDRKIEKEKHESLRKDLDKGVDACKMLKKFQLDQDKMDEIKIEQYLKQKTERDQFKKNEHKLTKEALNQRKQKFFEVQQKLVSLKANEEELDLRRAYEYMERKYRQTEKEKQEKKIEVLKEFSKCQENQLNEKKRRLELEKIESEEQHKKILLKIQEEDEKAKQMEEKRLLMKKKFKEDIIYQINQNGQKRHEINNQTKNEYNAWKKLEEEREHNIKIAIGLKLKALQESNIPKKCINDVQNKLNFIPNSY